MNEAEFVRSTERLEQYYDKEYTINQRKIMFDFLKKWNVEKYNRSINYCIKNNKYLPKIADLIDADTSIINTKTNKNIDFIKCSKCNGEGFIKYFKNIKDGTRIIKYEYIALCTCENGKKQKEINKYNLPTSEELGLVR